MDSYVFQCDVPHQWVAQRQVGPVSVYCDGVGCRDVTRLRCLKATLKQNNIYTIPLYEITPISPKSDLSIGLSLGEKNPYMYV